MGHEESANEIEERKREALQQSRSANERKERLYNVY